MNFWKWLASRPRELQKSGIQKTVRKSSIQAGRAFFRRIENKDIFATEIYERAWDLLVILDACRHDALASVADQYEFLPTDIPSIRSVGGSSNIWMKRNFTSKYRNKMEETAVVTANPYSDTHLEKSQFEILDEVWKYGWDNHRGTVPARQVTDRAIQLSRERSPERLIAHYMQPHFPSIPAPLGSGIELDTFGSNWDSVWEQLRKKEVTEKEAWESYMKNLRYVLDDVELLFENVDAEVAVISADHGNAFGEWGVYGHPPNIALSAIRKVPWVETMARNVGGYEHSFEKEMSSVNEEDIESRLEALGYR